MRPPPTSPDITSPDEPETPPLCPSPHDAAGRRSWRSRSPPSRPSRRPPGPDLDRAGQLIRDGRYAQAHALLQPVRRRDRSGRRGVRAAARQSGAADAAGRGGARAVRACPGGRAGFGRSPPRLGRAYLALGQYARSAIEFGPCCGSTTCPDLQLRAQIYADAAQAYAQGRRLLATGYARWSAGAGPRWRGRWRAARRRLRLGPVGGNLNYELADGGALDASLDYRFRDYDTEGRRNDSDPRWNEAYSPQRRRAELDRRRARTGQPPRRRQLPQRLRRLRQRPVAARRRQPARRRTGGAPAPLPSRAAARTDAQHRRGERQRTRSLLDGKASFTLARQAGREFNTPTPTATPTSSACRRPVSYSITETLGVGVRLVAERPPYNVERLGAPGDAIVGIGTRNDNLYEVGGGLTWQFAPKWSLNPEILYVRDRATCWPPTTARPRSGSPARGLLARTTETRRNPASEQKMSRLALTAMVVGGMVGPGRHLRCRAPSPTPPGRSAR